MKLDIVTEHPDYHFKYIEYHYHRDISPVIGGKSEEFLKIVDETPLTDMVGSKEERRRRFTALMHSHILELAESNSKYAKYAADLWERAGSFELVMCNKHREKLEAIRTAVRNFDMFVKVTEDVKTDKQLIEAIAEQPHLF